MPGFFASNIEISFFRFAVRSGRVSVSHSSSVTLPPDPPPEPPHALTSGLSPRARPPPARSTLRRDTPGAEVAALVDRFIACSLRTAGRAGRQYFVHVI